MTDAEIAALRSAVERMHPPATSTYLHAERVHARGSTKVLSLAGYREALAAGDAERSARQGGVKRG